MFRVNRKQAASIVNSAETRSQSGLQEPSWEEEEEKKKELWNDLYFNEEKEAVKKKKEKKEKKKRQSMSTFEI